MRDSHDHTQPLVQLDSVVVRTNDTTILDRVTLALGSGAPTALIGPNGSGKTTLLRAVMGLVEVNGGQITVDGAARAIVFQKPVMLRRSVADNIGFALSAANRAGAVYEMLTPFARRGVSMSKFESRPSKVAMWEYLFFVDIDGHQDDANVVAALSGGYPVHGGL